MKTALIYVLCIFIFPSFVGAADSNAPGERTEKGFQVAKQNFILIPEDQQVKKIANNVIAPESTEEYMARKFKTWEEQINAFGAKLEERLTKIEARLDDAEIAQQKLIDTFNSSTIPSEEPSLSPSVSPSPSV